MNLVTLALGVMAVLYGVYTFYVRASKPEKFSKLTAMQERFGKQVGYTIHLIAYSIAPLVFGAIMIFAGKNGYSLF
jgi:hypothetical protein